MNKSRKLKTRGIYNSTFYFRCVLNINPRQNTVKQRTQERNGRQARPKTKISNRMHASHRHRRYIEYQWECSQARPYCIDTNCVKSFTALFTTNAPTKVKLFLKLWTSYQLFLLIFQHTFINFKNSVNYLNIQYVNLKTNSYIVWSKRYVEMYSNFILGSINFLY